MAFEISPTVVADIPELVVVRTEAAQFKAAHGDYLWGEEPYTYEEVAGLVEVGGALTAWLDGEIAGMVRLTRDDERLWGPERGTDGTAIYIHSLATANRFRGRGLGKSIIAWTADLAPP